MWKGAKVACKRTRDHITFGAWRDAGGVRERVTGETSFLEALSSFQSRIIRSVVTQTMELLLLRYRNRAPTLRSPA